MCHLRPQIGSRVELYHVATLDATQLPPSPPSPPLGALTATVTLLPRCVATALTVQCRYCTVSTSACSSFFLFAVSVSCCLSCSAAG